MAVGLVKGLVMDTSSRSRLVPTLYLSDWRTFRGLTQRQLAERSGVALTSINEIETGKRTPRSSTLKRLATALQTEEWNLYNPARSSNGIMLEVEQIIERLGKAVMEISIQGPHGGSFADGLAGWKAMQDENATDIQGWAEEAIVFLIPLWLRLRQLESESVPKVDAQHDALIMSHALQYRIREWESRGVPSDVAEALLRAQIRAINMAAADANGDHDLIPAS